jgi:hypothetical protein
MLCVKAFVFGLIQGDLAHELPEVVEATLNTLKAHVGLVQTLIGLIQTLIGLVQALIGLVEPYNEILSQIPDTVPDFPKDLGRQIGSHNLQINWRKKEEKEEGVHLAKSLTPREFMAIWPISGCGFLEFNYNTQEDPA